MESERVNPTAAKRETPAKDETGTDAPPHHTATASTRKSRHSISEGMRRVAENPRFRWLMRHHATIGVVLSLVISIPLAIYKYNIAQGNERDLSAQSFTSSAASIVIACKVCNLPFARDLHSSFTRPGCCTLWIFLPVELISSITTPPPRVLSLVEKDFKFAAVAPLLLADFSIVAPGPLSSQQFRTFTDSSGYFSTIASGFSVGMYQHATSATVGFWREYMFSQLGGNFGSNSSFSFFDKNGTASYPNNNRDDFFFLHHMEKEDTPTVKTSLGYIADSDPVVRRPLIQQLRLTGQPTMTGRMTLVTSTLPTSVLIAAPIFRVSNGSAFTNVRSDDMDAFAWVGADVATMMGLSLPSLELDELIHVFVFDASAENPEESILGHFSNGVWPQVDWQLPYFNLTEVVVSAMPHDFITKYDVTLLDRTWRIVAIAKDGYVLGAQTKFPITVLIVALIEPAFSVIFHVSIFIVHRLWPHAKGH
ncbi:hypothetical protein DFJ73DRAFT_849334 [Zopfochytrium polystomum]|nr:hypothetical protein DFJ73DRAFT_849334 [Zopfochytrium polystomum]